ncbi:MAG: sulfate ABC transporter substrate-binding protein [Asticcacaulis sp.]
MRRRSVISGLGAFVGLAACGRPKATQGFELLNVSYDPTREFYEAFNAVFAENWLKSAGQTVAVKQSHGGSGKQARAVIDGLAADVVTLALSHDIDTIAARSGLLPRVWQGRLPYNSCPYSSTIVFLVRKGNPKQIKDWGDLTKTGVGIVTPNPKTGGGSRWNYLAGWGWALETYGTEAAAQDYVRALYRNVAVLDSGARGSTTSFVERGIGDVLLAWENEAFLALEKLGAEAFEIVVPSLSILAEPPVALIDKVTERKGTRAIAEAYLEQLYDTKGQTLAGQHYYRPSDPEVAAQFKDRFVQTRLITIRDLGGWPEVQARHFDNGGIYDAIMQK